MNTMKSKVTFLLLILLMSVNSFAQNIQKYRHNFGNFPILYEYFAEIESNHVKIFGEEYLNRDDTIDLYINNLCIKDFALKNESKSIITETHLKKGLNYIFVVSHRELTVSFFKLVDSDNNEFSLGHESGDGEKFQAAGILIYCKNE